MKTENSIRFKKQLFQIIYFRLDIYREETYNVVVNTLFSRRTAMKGMHMKNKSLTVFEAACIITGYGIGSGVLAMPYIVSQCGILLSAVILLLAFVFSYILHMMIADLAVKNGSKGQIVDIVMGYLPSGKSRGTVKTALFAVLALVLYTNLAVYIAGAAEILQGTLGLPVWAGKLVFYVFAAFIAIFGIKILGLCEKYAMYGIYAVVAALFIGSLFNIKNSISLMPSSLTALLSFFGVAMFAFVAFFSVPQVVEGLGGNVKNIKKSILIGMSVNLLIMMLVITGALLSSEEITEVSMTGWSAGIGLWAKIVGSVFTLLAMLTTYWSISVALRDIVRDAIRLGDWLCFIIASVPALLLAFLPSAGFLDFLELAAGAIAILIALFVIPVFHISRKRGPSILGRACTTPTEIIVFIAYILMAAGNLI